MTLYVKYALMNTGRATDRNFEAQDQEAVEAEIAKDLATGCTVVHGNITDETKTVIAKLESGESIFKAVPGTTGWTDRAT